VRWRPWCNSNTKAAKRAKVSINTVNTWRKSGVPIDEAVSLLADDGIIMAEEILHDALIEAAEVKAAGLRSRDERVKQGASSEIIDRNMGKATQKQQVDITSKGEQIAGGPSTEEQSRALVALYEALRDTVLAGRDGGQGAVATAE